jgi:hypothetical protein
MSDNSKMQYLVLSRGKWDPDKRPEEIQRAIDAFYQWYEQRVAEGRIQPGKRLGTAGKLVSRTQVTDGPFAETKEVIGGFWFIVADSLEDAAALAGENPCLSCGLSYEVRPIEPARASAYAVTNETLVAAPANPNA